MNLHSFIDEADRLVRPCRTYSLNGAGAPDAYWHGDRAGLWFSIRYREEWLNVLLSDDCTSGSVEVTDIPAVSSKPLFGKRSTSLPPVDAVFYFGSEEVGDYLRANNWPRNEPLNKNFPDSMPHTYESKHWQANCPAYQGDAILVSGGWHMPWPDGDWYDLADSELVAWSLLDAEPWVEVFRHGDAFKVVQRVS